MTQRTQDRKTDIVVFWVRRSTACADCGEELPSASLVHVADGIARCLDCSDLGHLVYLPRGDTALTRRATKHSKLRAVVVEWSRTRKRYERQGILVEEAALELAEEECIADADERAAQRERAVQYRGRADLRYVQEFARAVKERYPGCPTGTVEEVAEHACAKHSGRIGRSAEAKALSPKAVNLAVRAHVRHRHTGYDGYLMSGRDRDDARKAVAGDVEGVLESWRN